MEHVATVETILLIVQPPAGLHAEGDCNNSNFMFEDLEAISLRWSLIFL